MFVLAFFGHRTFSKITQFVNSAFNSSSAQRVKRKRRKNRRKQYRIYNVEKKKNRSIFSHSISVPFVSIESIAIVNVSRRRLWLIPTHRIFVNIAFGIALCVVLWLHCTYVYAFVSNHLYAYKWIGSHRFEYRIRSSSMQCTGCVIHRVYRQTRTNRQNCHCAIVPVGATSFNSKSKFSLALSLSLTFVPFIFISHSTTVFFTLLRINDTW